MKSQQIVRWGEMCRRHNITASHGGMVEKTEQLGIHCEEMKFLIHSR